VSAAALIIGFVTLILFFSLDEPFGTINDIASVFQVLFMTPLALGLYRINARIAHLRLPRSGQRRDDLFLSRGYGIWRAVRVTLAMTYVLPEDSNLSVVERLVQWMQYLGFRPGVMYMDKEFCEGPIMRYLTKAHIPAILACTIRGGKGGTRALCTGRKAYYTDYTFTDGTLAHLALMPARVPDKTGHRRVKWLAFVVIHLSWSAKKVAQRYRRRFGIESTYRQLNPCGTASRSPALRFFLLGLGFLLLNIWVLLRWLTTRLMAPGPACWDEDAFRLFHFIAFLRRAIEHAIGTIDTIPIYSW
jgi:putative transposase